MKRCSCLFLLAVARVWLACLRLILRLEGLSCYQYTWSIYNGCDWGVVVQSGASDLWWVRRNEFICYFIIYILMCLIGMCSKNWKSNHHHFHNKDPSLAHTAVSVTLSVYHSVHGPRPKVLLEKETLSKKVFVSAEGSRKICLTKSVRTHFLRGSRVCFAKWCSPNSFKQLWFNLKVYE